MESESIIIVNTRPEHAPILEKLQRINFPNLEEVMKAEHYLRHLDLFPEGQFVAIDTSRGDDPVGATTTFRINFDFAHPDHKFFEIVGNGWLSNHDPNGKWLYGADMMVHPEYRGKGIARKFYNARQELAKRLNLCGQVTAGMIPGYHLHADKYTIKAYMEKVAAGEMNDPTLSKQLKMGFRYIQPLYDHLTDPTSGNAAALIVMDNPDYRS